MLSIVITGARRLEEKALFITKTFKALSGFALVSMMLVVTIDATIRKIFNKSFYGSYDTVTYMLSILIFLSMVVCQNAKAHFSIDLITSMFPRKLQMWLYCVVSVISTCVCWLLSWRLVEYGFGLIKTHATSMEFNFLPTYPFAWIGALCFAILGFLLLLQSVDQLGKALDR